MCGLMGWDFNHIQLGRDQRMAIAALLCSGSDSRGGDSWGYFDVNEKTIAKGLGDISNISARLRKRTYLMGHTRKATTGGVTVDNSHPFEIGEIVGAHNGMIMNHDMLNELYDRKCVVDSEHIFHHINDGLPLDDIMGYGAIEWVDKRHPERVYLCRMGGGELSVFQIGHGKRTGVIWCSDEDHAKAALAAANIKKYTEFDIQTGKVYYVENGELYKTKQTMDLDGSYRSHGSYVPNRFGWLTTYESKGDEDATAQYMDRKEERHWEELFRVAEENRAKREESELDSEFKHTHALNGDDIHPSSWENDEDLDEAVKEWYESCGGDPSELNAKDLHPSFVKELAPNKA